MHYYLASALLWLATSGGGKPAEPAKKGPLGPEFFIAIAIFIIASIFLIQRPKQKQEAQRRKQLEEGLKKGTRVVSAGGIHGTVARVNKARDTVFVTVGKGLELEFSRTVLTVTVDKDEKKDEEEGAAKDK